MKQMVFVAVLATILGAAYAANGQATGGGGSGIGSGPPGALPNGGLGATNTPASNRDNTAVPRSAGFRDQPGSDVNEAHAPPASPPPASLPIVPTTSGGGFGDADINGHGRPLGSMLPGNGPSQGDGLITGSGMRNP